MSQRNQLVILLCAAWLLPGLIGHDPWKPDEAHTFGVVYQLLQGGSWVVPSLAGEPFLDKPPLFHLVAAACARIFSVLLPLHDAARLSTGLWMALTLYFIAAAARELNDERSGPLAVLLLLGCFGLVVRSHQLVADVAMLAGLAMAYYGCALALRRPGAGGICTGTGAGIGFLATGIAAPAIVFALALILPAFGRAWRSRNYASALGIAAATAAPWLVIWPVLLSHRSPALFDDVAVGLATERLRRRDLGHHEKCGLLPEDTAVVRLPRVAARPVGVVAHAAPEGMGGAARRPAARGIRRYAGGVERLDGRARALRAAHAAAPRASGGARSRQPAAGRDQRLVLVQRDDLDLLHRRVLVLLERARAGRARAPAPASAHDQARLRLRLQVDPVPDRGALHGRVVHRAREAAEERRAAGHRVGRGHHRHVGSARGSLRRLGRQRQELPVRVRGR